MSLYNKIIDIQKLNTAWRSVYKNKPKEGVDGITYEEFEQQSRQNIKELNDELKNHQYECQPVKLIPLYKGEKVRYIGLYCMRDKVVQNSISTELSRIYEPTFSRCCYAYRNGQSALQASEHIHKRICEMKEGYVLKTDIHGFFDFIQHSVLRDKLKKRIAEDDVIQLIFNSITAISMDRDGVLNEKKLGIYQGSSIAPILSNIYLLEFDHTVENEVDFYVRYSDDMILFFQSKETAEEYLEKIKLYLEALGLELNLNKTLISSFQEGFEFLGYFFNQNGKAVTEKAETQLADRLEEVWMNPLLRNISERLSKGREILTGWEQYYRDEREPGSILEYTVYASILINKNQFDPVNMAEIRKKLDNPYRDVAGYLLEQWKKSGNIELQLLEYEQYQQIYDEAEQITDGENPLVQELLRIHEKYYVLEDETEKTELIQIYSDLKQYRKAELLMDKVGKKVDKGPVKMDVQEGDIDYSFDTNDISEYMEFFVGREDLYSTDSIGGDGRRKVNDVLSPLIPEVVKKHLAGDETIGTYPQRTNATVKYLVIDIDISKRILLKNPDEALMKTYLEKALQVAAGIVKELRHMGLNGYLEFSGFRGYHVWLFCEEWVPARYAQLLSDMISERVSDNLKEGDIQIEYFPNKTRVNNGKRGQCMKLPLGIHPRTGTRSMFLDEDFRGYERQREALRDFGKCSLKSVKKAISSWQSNGTAQETIGGRMEVDTDISGFGNLSEAVRVVLLSCNLARFLCQKARTTHYLNHFERLTILYIFGHLGEEGKDFIHKVMEFTLNYSFQTTQKFVNKCPEKPISCLKLREQYKQISAEIGCSCAFKRSKDCYPSPVLHALKKADDTSQITIPMSRTVTEQKKELIKEEISLPIKLQNIIEKIMELRKQNRSIEKNIQKFETELGAIFDENHTDSIEIKQGVLSRHRAGDRIEWIIEL